MQRKNIIGYVAMILKNGVMCYMGVWRDGGGKGSGWEFTTFREYEFSY